MTPSFEPIIICSEAQEAEFNITYNADQRYLASTFILCVRRRSVLYVRGNCARQSAIPRATT